MTLGDVHLLDLKAVMRTSTLNIYFLFFFYFCLGVELPDHMGVLCLTY